MEPAFGVAPSFNVGRCTCSLVGAEIELVIFLRKICVKFGAKYSEAAKFHMCYVQSALVFSNPAPS
jgi:hypothetical protein